MNKKQMQQIFDHYIENFEMINDDEHEEYYKWQICAEFRQLMDEALMNYGRGAEPTASGGQTEWDNGNGSLMRILPVCLYLYERQKKVCTSENESIYAIHSASALTHAHLRSQLACGIYYFLVNALLDRPGTPVEWIDAIQKKEWIDELLVR